MEYYDIEYDSTLDKEMEFIEFLGYHIDDCKISGSWVILDENNKEIGSLNTDGRVYHTIIDSDKIHYDNKGVLNGCSFKGFSYEIKGKGKIRHRLTKESGSGTCRFIEYNSDELDIYITATSHGSKHLDVSCHIKKNDLITDTSMEYCYESGRYQYHDTCNSEKLSINESTFIYTDPPLFNYDPTKSLRINKSINGEWTTDIYNGSVEDFAKEHHKGIELVDRVRNIINEIIPHDGDILDYLFSEEVVDQCGFNMFFLNYEKESEKTR